MSEPRARFRAARWIGAVVVVIAVLAGAAPHLIEGPRFGRIVERLIPETRGRIQIGGGRWTWAAVVALLRGRPAAFEFEHVRVTDPEGTEVLRVAHLTGRIERRASAPRIVLHGVRIETGLWRYARMKDGKAGFLAAFGALGAKVSARTSPPRQARASEALTFAIADAVLEDVDVTLEFLDWGLALQNVRASGSLALPGGGREPVLTFDVKDADARGGGRLRVLSGAGAWQLPFSRARLDRVSTTRDAPDSLFLQASAVATGLSRLSLAGTFTGVYGVSRPRVPGGIDLQAQVADASDAIRAVAESRGVAWPPALAGRGSHLSLNFTGPFSRPRITVEGLVSAAGGGRVDATVSLEGRIIEARVGLTALATAPLLPPALVPWAGGILEGSARGRFDLASASVSAEEISLLLTRAPPEASPRIVRVLLGPAAPRAGRGAPKDSWTLNLAGADISTRAGAGLIRVPRLTTSFAGSRVVVSGQVGPWRRHGTALLGEPELDLLVRVDRLSLKRVLGSAFVDGHVSLNARARGRFSDLDIAVTLPPRQSLQVLGESFHLPGRFALALRDQDLRLSPLRLDGPQRSAFTVSGRVDMRGRMALAIGVDAFPLERLPGLAATSLPLAGRISGRVDLAGDVGQPTLAGQLSIDSVTFEGRRVGSGSLTISPTPSGATRARGRVLDGIDADGTLAVVPGGLRGDLTVRLGRLRLDPFIPPSTLPGGLSVASVVSGTIVARVAPGQPPVAEGRLSQLELTVTPPTGSARAKANVRPITLYAGSEIPFRAEGGDGSIRIGPARFAGNIGAFTLEGESQGGAGAVKGTFRGRVLLDPLAPLGAGLFDRLSGAVDVDLRAGRTNLHDPFQVNGSVTIAAPLLLRTRAASFEGRIPSGRIRFSGSSVETTALRVTVRDVSDRSGHSDGEFAVVVGTAGGAPGTAHFDSLAPPSLSRFDLPLRGEVSDFERSGIRIDQAMFSLRLQGQRARPFLLSGDIDVLRASMPSTLPSPGKQGATSPSPSASSPEIETTRLDLRLRSRPGAIEIRVPRVPDIRVGVDYHVGGTVKRPELGGQIRGDGAYSRSLLWLKDLIGRP